MTALALLWVLAAADPCAEVSPAPTPNAAEAEVYLKVGRAELAAGRADSAAEAFAQARRLDPGNPGPRAELGRLCAAGDGGAAKLKEAIALMNRGALREASARFERLRPDPQAALLEGICRYELGEDDEAERRLTLAREDPTLRDHADLFLGLLELRAGRSGAAEARLLPLASSSDRALTQAAEPLLRLSRREGKLQVQLSTEAGYDSNVDLAPGTFSFASGSGDGMALVEGAVAFRPWGQNGAFATVGGGYRKLFTLTGYDTGLARGTAGWQHGAGRWRGAAEYGYDFLAFGGAPYLTAHHLGASGRWARDRLTLGAAYAFRWEAFLPEDKQGYSGARQLLGVEAAYRLGRRATLAAGYGLGGDLPADLALRYLEHGPDARLELELAPTARTYVAATVRDRAYAEDFDLGLARRELTVGGQLRFEWDLFSRWAVFVAVEGESVTSNLPELSHGRLAGSLGFSFAQGWP